MAVAEAEGLSLPPQPKPSWVWPSLGWSTLNCRCGPPDKPCFQTRGPPRTSIVRAPVSHWLLRACCLQAGAAHCCLALPLFHVNRDRSDLYYNATTECRRRGLPLDLGFVAAVLGAYHVL